MNIIEVLPFLNEGAIIILHDIILHFWRFKNYKEVKFTPTQVYLMSSLFGEKIYNINNQKRFQNIGAVKLYPNQESHYLDYFLLLSSFWEKMPSEIQINDLRSFIKKYYIKEIYLNLFNSAVEENRYYIKNYTEKLKIYYYNYNS